MGIAVPQSVLGAIILKDMCSALVMQVARHLDCHNIVEIMSRYPLQLYVTLSSYVCNVIAGNAMCSPTAYI